MIYKVGLTASCFDLLHSGHISMLREAKSYCDHLICCLQTHPEIDRPSKSKPVQSIVERYIQLSAVKYIDEIIPYTRESDLIDILNMMSVDVRIIGEDYVGKSFTGDDMGIKTIYNKRAHSFSSTELKKRVIKSIEIGGNV